LTAIETMFKWRIEMNRLYVNFVFIYFMYSIIKY
jgi:hypothetical protein